MFALLCLFLLSVYVVQKMSLTLQDKIVFEIKKLFPNK